VAELGDLLHGVAVGDPPVGEDGLTVVQPPDERSVVVLSFPAQNVLSAAVTEDWARSCLPPGRPDVPLSPAFLALLAAVTGRVVEGIDQLLVATAHGRHRESALTEVTDSGHPRLRRTLDRRTDIRVFTCEGGLLLLGRGVAGRWEAAVEVDPMVRGFGLGRALFATALGTVPAGEHVWLQIAPGNAASTRAALAAGYRPVGAEALLSPVPAGTPVVEPFTPPEAGVRPLPLPDATEPATEVDWFRPHTEAEFPAVDDQTSQQVIADPEQVGRS
jgi:hypothetical protein